MLKKTQPAKSFLSAFLLLVCVALCAGQSVPLEQNTPSKPGAAQAAVVTQQSGSTDEPLVYGLQGVLIETVAGKTVSAQAADQAFNPASSVKLGVALVALHNFGPQYQIGRAHV